MGLLKTLRGWWKGSPARTPHRYGGAMPLPLPPDVEADIDAAAARQSEHTRRFIARDRRVDRQAWPEVFDQSINQDLQTDLPDLMARAAYAFTHNPIFEGVVNTFCQDVVGPQGPGLQIICDEDKAFSETVEEAWKQVFSDPDPVGTGNLGGVENMRMWVRLLMLAGSFLNVFLPKRREATPVNIAWKTIHPRRMKTPAEFAFDENVAFGIRFNADGAPVKYYLDRPQRFGSSAISGIDYDVYPVDQVQHRFLVVEPEQMTGYPMMTSPLDTVADVNELDGYTMEAAKSAAAHSWWLESADPSKVSDPDPIPTPTLPLFKNAVNVAPAGWRAQGLQATQPTADGMAYRSSRLMEFGRPVNMPLLIILLSVNDATFSSAQFAGALYRDGIRSIQGFLERSTLAQILQRVVTQLVLLGKVKKPKRWSAIWTHNVPPHANIEKFVGALEAMVSNGFISPADASALLGYDWDKVVEARKRCAADLEGANLPPPPVNAGNPPKPDAPPNEPAQAGSPSSNGTKPKKPAVAAVPKRREAVDAGAAL